MSSWDSGLFIAFLTLHMFGALGSLIVLVTAALSNSVPRHPTWYSFMFSWILSSLSYSLLLFTGHKDDPTPPFGLCLTQASLIYAALPMTSGTVIALGTQVYFKVRNWLSEREREIREPKWLFPILLPLPYVLHITMLIGCLVVGLKNRETVQRPPDGFFCNFIIRVPSRISSASVAILTIPTLVLQVMTLLRLRRNWHLLKGSILRVLLFSCFCIVAVVLGIVFAAGSDRGPPFLNVIVATVPVAAVLIFGSQKDLLGVWMFWQPRRTVIRKPTGFSSSSNNDDSLNRSRSTNHGTITIETTRKEYTTLEVDLNLNLKHGLNGSHHHGHGVRMDDLEMSIHPKGIGVGKGEDVVAAVEPTRSPTSTAPIHLRLHNDHDHREW